MAKWLMETVESSIFLHDWKFMIIQDFWTTEDLPEKSKFVKIFILIRLPSNQSSFPA